MRSIRSAWLFAATCVFAVATAAFGAVPTSNTAAAPNVRTTAASASIHANVPTTSKNGSFTGPVAPGTVVPLSHLPALPPKNLINTMTPKLLRAHLRRFAANGASINITNTTCGGQNGDLFPVGCTLTWQSQDMPATDTKQDFLIISTNGNELTTGATATGATYTAAAGAAHNTVLATAGTYILGTFDNTKGTWVAVVYVNAGAVFSVEVFQDAFHTSQTYQFDAAASPDAFVFLQNVAQSDFYVVGVNQTGVNPNCVFMAPVPTPSPFTFTANQLCPLTSSAGVQAPGGNLSVTWPINANLPSGNYSVEVYDLTQGERLGQVQVSLTGSSGIVLSTLPDASGANANPSPNPHAVATPSTIVDWDGGANPGPQDESVTGIKAQVTGLQNGNNYLWTLSDPQGQVVSEVAGTVAGNAASQTFTFDALAGGAATMIPPGRYPAKSFVIQLYNTTTKTVAASQSFQLLGYSTETQFNQTGTLKTSLALTPGAAGTSVGLRLTNTSNTVFNGQGDNLSQLIFSTGNDFNASTTTGNGIMVSSVGGATTPCASCSTTATDSNGNTWNVTITCSGAVSNKNGECNILFEPSSASVFLAPGAFVEVDGLTWFDATASTCGNSCQGLTSEFPQHGLQWSCSSGIAACPAGSISSDPVFFRDAASTLSGTANIKYIGSVNAGTTNQLASPFTPPYVDNHYFKTFFEQADYNGVSPFTIPDAGVGNPGGTNLDVQALTIANTSTTASQIDEIAVAYPPIIHDQSFVVATGGVGTATCPAEFHSATICYTPAANITKGTSATLILEQSPPLQSIAFTDLVIFAHDATSGQWFQLTPAAGGVSTPDGLFTGLDNLTVGYYSLTASDMTAFFSPSTVGEGANATLGFSFQNTSTAVDPNPDSVDALVLEAPSTGLNLTSTGITSSLPGWTFLGSFKLNGSADTQYWFGLCATQFNDGAQQGANYGGPPTAVGSPTNILTTNVPYPTLGNACTESEAIRPAQELAVANMVFTNFNATGAQTWHMYAHGADGGGWSSAQNMALSVTTESASIKFNQVNGATIATDAVPTIGGTPNTYQYAITNTSKTSDIGTILITLPGTDINGQNAFDGTNTWSIANIDTAGSITLSNPAGQAGTTEGCTVSTVAANTFNPTAAGANGQIEVTGCTSFAPGDTIFVNFTATNPEAENDSYVFPAKIDGNAGGASWLGSDEVTEEFSLGLDVIVDPTNPGPGGSTPVVNCANACAFSGTTIDFGNIADNQTFAFKDVVRTSVIYTGATSAGHNLDLFVSASQNPVNSSGSPTNELLTEVDQADSSKTAGMTFLQTAFGVIPTTSPGLEIATAPETDNANPYDIIDSFEVALGPTDTITARIVTVTYTLVAN